jgi:outer membrane receptor protein involved in Fe transport
MIHSRRMASLLSACSASALMLAAAPGAFAQGADENDEAETEVRDVITVTVERREQSIQDVAATVASFDGESLKDLGIQTFADLNGRYPGLQVANNQPAISKFIFAASGRRTIPSWASRRRRPTWTAFIFRARLASARPSSTFSALK